MIRSLYILKLNGVLLYSYSYGEEPISEHIFAGFLASIANFSQESLQSLIDRVDLGNNQILVLYKPSNEKIIYAATISKKDNVQLTQTILADFAELFGTEYGPNYSPEKIDDAKTIGFFEQILNPRLISRNKITKIIAFGVSLILICAIAYLIYQFTEYFYIYMGLEKGAKISWDVNSRYLLYLIIIAAGGVFLLYPINMFLLGYLNGEIIPSRISAFVILIILHIWFFILRDTLFWVFLVFFPLAWVMSYFFIDLGIKFVNMRKMDKRLS